MTQFDILFVIRWTGFRPENGGQDQPGDIKRDQGQAR